MTLFVALAALLAALALAFILPPLLRAGKENAAPPGEEVNSRIYREQLAELRAERDKGTLGEEAFRRALRELEHRIVAESGGAEAGTPRRPLAAAALAVALLVPLLAGVGYWKLGAPDALLPGATTPLAQPSKEQIEDLVERLWDRMQKTPADAEGWALLGRSFVALGKHERAAQAFARAVKLVPNDAGLLADYGDALAVSRGRVLEGEPLALARRALEIDPQHLKALALAGAGEFQAGNHAAAAVYWRRVLAMIPADSDFARQLQSSLEESQRALQKDGRALSGIVSLDPKLAAAASPGDTVFVIARPAGGGRMPLAVARTTVAALPYRFSLDDSMAMTPGTTLSGQANVIVAARISKSGNPMPQKGDMEGVSAPVSPTATGLKVVISKVIQ